MVGPWPPGPGAAPSGAPAPGPGRIENKNNEIKQWQKCESFS